MTRLLAGYVRRSTATSSNPGNDSREAQEAAIRHLSGDVTEYIDWGVSGSGDGSKRPEYQRLKADIEAGLVQSVTAYSLTRLGRNARELLGFAELCRAHDVILRTAQESIDTSSAMGRAMLGMMAVMAELELEQGKERSESARQARKARHEAAGLVVPSSTPAYGYKHLTENGITRVERDDAIVFDPIVAAYEEAGSVRGTAVLLNERGIPAPKGGLWNLTPLYKVLERLADDGLVTLPERNGRLRHPTGKDALFAGLLLCHCGRRLTPNVTRGQYYCAAARSNADHGRMSTTEKALLAILVPEAEAYHRTIHIEGRAASEDLGRKRGVIERRQAALDARLDVDRISPEAYKEATRALHQELADLHRDTAVSKSLRLEQVPSWSEVAAMNRHLRRIWTRVQLDPGMHPEPFWRDPRWRFDEERQLRQEAELRDPEGAGLMVT
jgi:DNA invertase Pin-like site-specific DNA recombinase